MSGVRNYCKNVSIKIKSWKKSLLNLLRSQYVFILYDALVLREQVLLD